MPDQSSPNQKPEATDEERRKAAARPSKQNPTDQRGPQIHAASPTQPTKAKPGQVDGRSGSHDAFEPAGRAVRAKPSARPFTAAAAADGVDEEADESPDLDDQSDLKTDPEV